MSLLDASRALYYSIAMSTSCVCSICLSDFVDPICTPCGHVYCSNCIAQATNILRNEGSTTTPCPACRQQFSIRHDPLSRDFPEYFGYPPGAVHEWNMGQF
ncbi:uncharacterized protein EV420DRAFT_1505995 [Desarmillaria tabescens]|uniref:RING-type domain-containing protein n=1 Tax=Armillaria tabescens TaxID=1929756 RepID=A0AA39TYN3_ARMTA|nr:uncharacterized protein EV420DRAFT_1505995 [Desarmillaria tabescens]KAK0466889.1 hypothetical protein EV420DRAFT_1505995 [Desarmillaria tabescens]